MSNYDDPIIMDKRILNINIREEVDCRDTPARCCQIHTFVKIVLEFVTDAPVLVVFICNTIFFINIIRLLRRVDGNNTVLIGNFKIQTIFLPWKTVKLENEDDKLVFKFPKLSFNLKSYKNCDFSNLNHKLFLCKSMKKSP